MTTAYDNYAVLTKATFILRLLVSDCNALKMKRQAFSPAAPNKRLYVYSKKSRFVYIQAKLLSHRSIGTGH